MEVLSRAHHTGWVKFSNKNTNDPTKNKTPTLADELGNG